MEIPAQFSQRVRSSLGDAGATWLHDLPALVARLAEAWHVSIGEPFGLSYNYVARARRHDGAEAVMKISPPWGDGELEREIAALREYDGAGACRLIAADGERRAMLLERVMPGETLAVVAATGDDEATRIGADAMRRLWRSAADLREPSRFRPLAEWFRAFERHRQFYAGPGPFPAALLARAEAIVADLLVSAPSEVLLHADFHHDNVISSARGGWLAIDPKGMLGDPGYEVGPFMLNPDISRTVKSAALLNRRLDILAESLRYDRDRLRDWAVAHAMLSACWSAENNGDGWQTAVAAAQNLLGT